MQSWSNRVLVVPGRYHLANRLPCQDSAFAAENAGRGISVLAVADGVGSREHSEVGALLVSRLAALAVLDHLAEGGTFAEVPKVVRERYTESIRPLVYGLGSKESGLLLPATLVLLANVKGVGLAVWRAGDGEAAIVGVPASVKVQAGAQVSASQERGGLSTWTWRHHADSRKGQKVRDLPVQWLTGGADLEWVMEATIPEDEDVWGAYVATDGMTPSVRSMLLARPVAKTTELAALADTDAGDDDLGVAWGGHMLHQVMRDTNGGAG